MPKRGQRLPWRMRYEWPSSTARGTDAFGTREDALLAGRRVAARVSPVDGESRPAVTVWHRDRPDEVETIPNPPIVENPCEWCGAELENVDDPVDACDPSCDCPPCEGQRAVDADADAAIDYARHS